MADVLSELEVLDADAYHAASWGSRREGAQIKGAGPSEAVDADWCAGQEVAAIDQLHLRGQLMDYDYGRGLWEVVSEDGFQQSGSSRRLLDRA